MDQFLSNIYESRGSSTPKRRNEICFCNWTYADDAKKRKPVRKHPKEDSTLSQGNENGFGVDIISQPFFKLPTWLWIWLTNIFPVSKRLSLLFGRSYIKI
ncbi:hypothetical protein ACTXT7_009150 [Hymenolepis weldensis]